MSIKDHTDPFYESFDFPEKRLPILRNMNLGSVCALMSEGNRNLLVLLQLCAEVSPQMLLHLDSMNMRGAQIWTAFAGFSNKFFPHFKECVLSRNQDMIAYVNQKVPQIKAVKDFGHLRS